MNSNHFLLSYFIQSPDGTQKQHKLNVTLSQRAKDDLFHIVNINTASVGEEKLLELYKARLYQNPDYPVTVRLMPEEGKEISSEDKQAKVNLAIDTGEFLVHNDDLVKIY